MPPSAQGGHAPLESREQEDACPQCGRAARREGGAEQGAATGGTDAVRMRLGLEEAGLPGLTPVGVMPQARPASPVFFACGPRLAQAYSPPQCPVDAPPPTVREAVASPDTAASARLALAAMEASGAASGHARRVGALFALADRLVAEGVLAGPLGGMGVQHRLQKCVYIAQRLGARIGYEFDFLANGAFSTELAVDACHRGDARGGSDPFGGMPGRLERFLVLVRGRTTEWLQLATFAARPADKPSSRGEFVDRVAWNGSGYDRRLAARVFDAVASLGVSGGAQRGE